MPARWFSCLLSLRCWRLGNLCLCRLISALACAASFRDGALGEGQAAQLWWSFLLLLGPAGALLSSPSSTACHPTITAALHEGRRLRCLQLSTQHPQVPHCLRSYSDFADIADAAATQGCLAALASSPISWLSGVRKNSWSRAISKSLSAGGLMFNTCVVPVRSRSPGPLSRKALAPPQRFC